MIQYIVLEDDTLPVNTVEEIEFAERCLRDASIESATVCESVEDSLLEAENNCWANERETNMKIFAAK